MCQLGESEPMNIVLKWILGAVVAILLVPVGVYIFLDLNSYKPWLSHAVETNSGRSLVIEGNLKLRLLGTPKIHAKSIRYSSEPWSARKWTVEIEHADLVFSPWALFKGKLKLKNIILENPNLRVEKDTPIDQLVPDPNLEKARSLPEWLEIANLEIKNGNITVFSTDRRWDIEIEQGNASNNGNGNAAPIEVDVRGAVEQTEIVASATVGSLETLFYYQPSPISAEGYIGAETNHVQAVGTAQNLLLWIGVDLRANVDADQLPPLSPLVDTEVPDIGAVQGSAWFYQPDDYTSMQLREIKLHSTGLGLYDLGLRGELVGEIPELYLLNYMDLHLSADGIFKHSSSELVKRLSPLHAQLDADLRGPIDNLNLHVNNAKLKSEDLDFSTQGTITHVNGTWEKALPTSLLVSDFARVSGWPDRVSAQIGAVGTKAELVIAQGGWNLRGLKLQIVREAFSMQLNGIIYGLGSEMRADIDHTTELDTSEAAQDLFGSWKSKISLPLPLSVSGKLYSAGYARWGIRDTQATSPGYPELDISFEIQSEQEYTSIENVQAVMNFPDMKMKLYGDIERWSPFSIDRMILELDANQISALGKLSPDLLNPDTPIAGNFIFSVNGSHIQGNTNLEIGASDMRGKLEWRLPSDQETSHVMQADLVSEQFDLGEMLAAAETPKFFSPTRFNTEWLRKVNGSVEVEADNYATSSIRLQDAVSQTRLQDGKLQQTLIGAAGQNELTINIAMDANSAPPSSTFNMSGKQLDIANLIQFDDSNYVGGGVFDVDVDFSANGNSIAEMAAATDGKVLLRMDGGKIKDQNLNRLGGDIITNLVLALNPARSHGEHINVECGFLELDVKQGLAKIRNKLAVKTDKVTLFGIGSLNFSDESLKVVLMPKARKGLGINPSSLVKVARVGGTFTEPKIEIDGSRFFHTGVSLWAALATGGWTLLLQGLRDLYQANTEECGLDAEQKPPSQPQPQPVSENEFEADRRK